MFTLNHFIWMGICALIIALLTFFSVRCRFSLKTALLIMSGISLASELCKIFTHIEQSDNGGVLEPGALPFHLCSILIFLIFYATFSKDGKRRGQVLSFIVPIAIWGGLLAIVMATSGVDFAKPFAYQCFVYHAGLVWLALYLILTKQVELGKRAYITNISVLAVLLFVMIWANSLLSVYDTNFFYVVRPPADGLPLLNLNNGWFVYFFTLVAIGLVLITLTHLPAMIKERKDDGGE